MSVLTDEALTYALGRAKDHARVHSGKSFDERREALDITLEALGFTDDLKRKLVEWLEVNGGAGQQAPICFGLFIGLFALEYEKSISE